jgi:hypothetical protein
MNAEPIRQAIFVCRPREGPGPLFFLFDTNYWPLIHSINLLSNEAVFQASDNDRL